MEIAEKETNALSYILFQMDKSLIINIYARVERITMLKNFRNMYVFQRKAQLLHVITIIIAPTPNDAQTIAIPIGSTWNVNESK